MAGNEHRRARLSIDISGQARRRIRMAAAVLTRQDVLLSWNFKHLVNRRRRAQINDQNILLGLPTIEILAPPEI